jgi:hypothetical protein
MNSKYGTPVDERCSVLDIDDKCELDAMYDEVDAASRIW